MAPINYWNVDEIFVIADLAEMGLTEEEIKRLYRIQKTLMQMLKDRGYFIADSEITMSLSQFVRKYGDNMKREDLVTLKAKRNDSSDQVLSLLPET